MPDAGLSGLSFQRGQDRRFREYFDMATMLRQLGVNPQILTASS